MTAEVAILNPTGVALAADSAVTIGDKVYNSVNKLFTLSKHHPVGIMVYNSADVMTMPVETVVKEFRRILGETCYDTLEEYCERFVRFLREEKVMFSDEARAADYLSKVEVTLYTLRRKASEIVRKLGAAGEDSKTITKAVSAEVKRFVERVERLDLAEGCAEQDIETVLAGIAAHRDEILNQAVEETPLAASLKKRLLRAAASLYVRRYTPLSYTGIVIAGFGNKEFLPRLRSFHFYGSSFGVTRIEHMESVNIGARNEFGSIDNAAVIGFAQSDMVRTFMNGMAPDVVTQASRSVLDTFDKMKESFAKTMPDGDVDLVMRATDAIAQDVVKTLRDRLVEYTVEVHYLPTIQTVEGLPKEDLARMAESLVSITSLKRKATGKLETVGGPIDVAIISKGDGFVFTQRKHYFDPQLNPAFIHNYFRTP